jgi:hypothetical protein
MPKRTTRNNAKIFWKTLITPGYSLIDECQRTKSPRDLAHVLGPKLAREYSHEVFDMCFGEIMDRKYPPMTVVKIVQAWLMTHSVPAVPSELSNFDRFHKSFGAYIVANQSMPNKRFRVKNSVDK